VIAPARGGTSRNCVDHDWIVETGDSLRALTMWGRQEGKFLDSEEQHSWK
jgi:hypothetical protein